MEHRATVSDAIPCLSIGTARLPKSIAGEEPGTFAIELSLDADDGKIIDIASTLALPNYAALLRRLFIGRRLDEVERVAQQLAAHVRGPLLRPTVAALANAVANHANGELAPDASPA